MANLDLAGIITRVCTDLRGKFAALSHTHGSISNTGSITSDTTVASGDKLVITDSSDSSKLKRSGISFGSSTTTFLRNDGTWSATSVGVSDVTLDGTSVVTGGVAALTSTDIASTDDGNGNVTIYLTSVS